MPVLVRLCIYDFCSTNQLSDEGHPLLLYRYQFNANATNLSWNGTFLTTRFMFRSERTINKLFCKRSNRGNVHVTWHWGAFANQLLPWKSSKYFIFWMCVCVFLYVTLVIQPDKRMSRIFFCGLHLYQICLNYSINGTVFEKKVTKHKRRVLIFCTVFCRKYFFSIKNSARYYLEGKSVFI
jgi:hypothetical protein